nr:MAG TPA: hypothetical protein [Caudoviricetes sp.]
MLTGIPLSRKMLVTITNNWNEFTITQILRKCNCLR